MVDSIANKIAKYFIENNYIEVSKKNHFEYGIFELISSALHIFFLLLVSIPFRTVPYIAIFSLFFCQLKKYCGGTHASTQLRCQISFTLLAFIASLFGIVPIPEMASKMLSITFAIFAFIIIFFWAPIPHPNKPVKEEELKTFRKKALLISTIETSIIIPLCVSGNYLPLMLCASIGALTSSLTLMPMIIQKGEFKS